MGLTKAGRNSGVVLISNDRNCRILLDIFLYVNLSVSLLGAWQTV